MSWSKSEPMEDMQERKPLEIYVHIPFCARKCPYCDFVSGPSTKKERIDYVKSLCQKIRRAADQAEAYFVQSVFIGGGTPSLLEVDLLADIFDAVRDTFFLSPQAEITIEMNPGTVTKEKLTAYLQLGINRFSIGLQSASDTELKTLGRIHTYQDFLSTYRWAREAGCTNINVDLMSAIPGQTLGSWRETLVKVADLRPEHISAYSLIVEEGTPFYEAYGPGDVLDEETDRTMYADTKRILSEYGYHRYEISNYARDGYECRHNLGYWDRTEYLGFGKSAASLFHNERWVEGEPHEVLSRKEQMAECMFLGLRKMEGVSKEAFRAQFGQPMEAVYGAQIQDMVEKGLLKDEKGHVFLTDRGIDLSNYVMSEFV